MTARALLKPHVWQPEDPELVFTRVPLSTPNEYFEIVLTPEEATRFAIDLLNDAQRAAYLRDVNARLKGRKPKI